MHTLASQWPWRNSSGRTLTSGPYACGVEELHGYYDALPTRVYEAGGVLVHDFFKPEFDLAWLRRIPPTPAPVGPTVARTNFFKKAKGKNLLADVPEGTDYAAHVLANFFPRDRGKARYFQEQVRAGTAQLTRVARALFPGYDLGPPADYSWRLTETAGEAMHFDSYGYAHEERHAVRVFVNIDDRPRLWAVGPCVDDAVREHAELVRGPLPEILDADLRAALPADWRAAHPNLFNAVLNALLPWEGLPRAWVLLAPGALWAVNSQVVAHEIVWGRRLLAYTFYTDAAKMADPSRCHAATVRRALRALGCRNDQSEAAR